MKKAKDFIAHLLYRMVTAVVKLMPERKGSKHLLIIKVDEIGDYMLFRNMLRYIRESEKYKGYRITLLGNALWKPIFEVYDAHNVDDTIWLTKKDFNKSLSYRFRILKQVRQLQTSDVVNSIFSRSLILDDAFAFVATGNEKVAMKGDNANRGKNGANLDSTIYTRVINLSDRRVFDAIQNSNFIGQLLGVPVSPSNRLTVVKRQNYSYKNYFVISLGAGRPERKWPLQYFVACAESVNEKYGLLPIISGAPSDAEEAKEFARLYGKEVINMIGKTSLPDFIELLGDAKFLLSVDSGPVHMAAAAGCPVVGLFSGVYYGRYAPYPQEMANVFVAVYPDQVNELIRTGDESLYNPFLLKNETRYIAPAKVTMAIDKLVESGSVKVS